METVGNLIGKTGPIFFAFLNSGLKIIAKNVLWFPFHTKINLLPVRFYRKTLCMDKLNGY